MVKLKQNNIEYIYQVVKTAQLVNVDSVIIEPDLVRGIDENQTVILFQNENVPTLPFGSIGLNRPDVFLSRYEIAKSQDNFAIEADQDDNNQFARSLTLKGKGTKIQYRCANPTTIKAPRKLKDTMKVSVQTDEQAVRLLQKGQAAMSNPETVSLISNDDGVSFELADINGDIFKHTFADDVQLIDGDDYMFAHKYPIKTLLSLLKSNPTQPFKIGHKGMLQFPVQDLNVYLIPQV